MIELIFYKGPEGLMGKTIRLWTHSPYSHCELHFGGGECWSSRAGTGVGWVQRRIYAEDWGVIQIPGVGNMEAKLRAWCEGEVGCKYDWKGIFLSQLLPWNLHSPGRWFCSEACCAALQQVGLFPGVKPFQQSPKRLYRLASGA